MAKKVGSAPSQFHQRFNIEVGIEEARERFVNRVKNIVPRYLAGIRTGNEYKFCLRHLSYQLGRAYYADFKFVNLVGHSFHDCLQTLEAIYEVLTKPERRIFSTSIVEHILSLSEVDLGIRWKDGHFYPSGATLLDEQLVNEPLKWLSKPEYRNVLGHFRKGLTDRT